MPQAPPRPSSFATDRVIRRRSIRMIRAAPPVPRRVPRSRGLTVVAVPADTGCTIRLETPAPGWRTADRGVEELTGRDIVACLAHSPGHRAVRAGARLEYAMSLGCRQE